MIIDTHCHVYPRLSDYFQNWIETDSYFNYPVHQSLQKSIQHIEKKIQKIKSRYRLASDHFKELNYLKFLHQIRSHSHFFPHQLIPLTDLCVSLMGAPHTLWENNLLDLFFHMQKNHVDYSIVIASPPMIPNDFVIHVGNQHKNIIAFVKIPSDQLSCAQKLEHYIKLGAKGVCIDINTTTDSTDIMSDYYMSQLDIANKYKIPVLLHTASLHLPLHPKQWSLDTQMAYAQKLQPWFSDFPDIKFILSHMNYHFPEIAIELMQNYPNIYAQTSWQKVKLIVNAIRKNGDERLLYASDWPYLGDNIHISINHIKSACKESKITEESKNKILGLNAKDIFKL